MRINNLQVQWMFETRLLLIVPDIKDKSEKMLSVSEDHCVCRVYLSVSTSDTVGKALTLLAHRTRS